ncbi:hypothetical protein BJ944DRAFT_269858 [Cunninghamella echinulata]|nr:hypothetical protein BJ944DRAFT_269858 [Cunninghamella echinulata]
MSAFQNIRNLTTGGNQMQQDTIASSSLPMTTTLNNIHDHTCITSTTNNNNHNIKSNLTTTTNDSCIGVNEIEECCICLYALAPHQALFVSPCAHTYHYKCIRPLLESYPGFQCPICRTYSDLEANIHMESHEVIEKYGLQRQSTIINHHHSHPSVNETSTSNIVNNNNNINHSSPLPSPSSSSSSSSSDSEPSPTSPHDLSPLMISPTINYLNENNTQSSQPLTTRDNRQTIIMDHTINNQPHETNHQFESDHSHTGEIEMTTSQGLTTTNFNSQQEEETEEELENNNNMMMMTSPDMEMNVSTTTSPNSTSPQPPQSASSSSSLPQQQQQTTTASSSSNNVRYPKRSNGTKFVEKLKMVFLEKRKSSIILAPRERKRSNRPRPLSYPHFLRRQDEEEIEEDVEQQQQQQQNVILQRSSISNDDAMSTSYPLSNATTSQILSRQSTHLAEIEEVDELPWHNNFNQFRQPMSVD